MTMKFFFCFFLIFTFDQRQMAMKKNLERRIMFPAICNFSSTNASNNPSKMFSVWLVDGKTNLRSFYIWKIKKLIDNCTHRYHQNEWVFQKRNNQKGEGKKSKVEKSTSSADLLFSQSNHHHHHTIINLIKQKSNNELNECNEQHSFIHLLSTNDNANEMKQNKNSVKRNKIDKIIIIHRWLSLKFCKFKWQLSSLSK